MIAVLHAAPVLGQYRFEYWTTDRGLPQNSVYAITQTRDGYLWFATLDGLVRHDGVRFAVFDRSNSGGLSSNRFTCLHEDDQGTLWAGTEDGGLTAFRDGRFTSFTTAEGLPANGVWRIEGDPAGGLLLYVWTKGWTRFRDGRFTPYSESGGFDGFHDYRGASGARWRWDRAGLHRFQNGRETAFAIPLDKPGGRFAARLLEDREALVRDRPLTQRLTASIDF